MNKQRSPVQLTDLPDELLLMIFKSMNNVQLLYSIAGVNSRLDRTIFDPIFTRNLTLFRSIGSNSLICSLVDSELHRFCSEILPQIHYEIHTLHLELSSMERILCASDYPNLRQLALYNIDDETAERIFSRKT